MVGISKLVRVVDTFARRLQVQETMNAHIANSIRNVLGSKSVPVVIEATHQCMTTRGVHKPGVTTVTSTISGECRTKPPTRRDPLTLIGNTPWSADG